MKKAQYPPEQYKIEAKVEEDIQNLPTCGVFGGAGPGADDRAQGVQGA